MRDLEVSLIQWPDGREAGGPRLLGRTTDPECITLVRSQLAKEKAEDLERLTDPIRLVPEPED